jgi:hypothetical protein
VLNLYSYDLQGRRIVESTGIQPDTESEPPVGPYVSIIPS